MASPGGVEGRVATPRRRWARLAAGVALVVVVHTVGTAVATGHSPRCGCAAPPWMPPRPPGPPPPPPDGAPGLRVAAYNLHSGLGSRLALAQPREVVQRNLRVIAATLAAGAPREAPFDVIGLNEVDFGARRSGGFDQAEFLARELSRLTGHPYRAVRGVTWERRAPGFEVRFGNAALVRHPIVRHDAVAFDDAAGEDGLPPVRSPELLDRVTREARGVVKLTLATPAGEVDALVTHLDAFAQAEREAQAVHLVRRHVRPGRTTVLLGDLNAVPTPLTLGRRFCEDDLTHDLLTSGSLVDARIVLAARDGDGGLGRFATFPADAPRWPLDGVLVTHDLAVVGAQVLGTTASDHRGLGVELRLTRDVELVRRGRAWHDALRARQLAHLEACSEGAPLRAALGVVRDRRAERRRRLIAASGFADLLAGPGTSGAR